MLFAAAPCFMFPKAVQRQVRIPAQRVKCRGVQGVRIAGDIFQRDAAHPAHRPGEIPVDHLFRDPHRLEDLGSLVGLDRGDAHLGRDLHDAVEHRMGVVIHRRIIILVKQSLFDQFPDGLQRQVRVHRTGPVSEQRCEMMDLSWLSGLQDEGHGRLLLRLHQILMDRRHRQKGRDRHMVLVHAPVGQDQDIGPVPVCLVHLYAQMLQGALQLRAFIVNDRNDRHAEPVPVKIFDLQHIRIRQDRILDLQHLAVLRFLFDQIAVFPHIDRRPCDDLLTDRIDGRIGHLGKELLKVIKQRAVLL